MKENVFITPKQIINKPATLLKIYSLGSTYLETLRKFLKQLISHNSTQRLLLKIENIK